MSDRKEKLKPFLYPLAFVVLAALSLAYKLFMNGSSSGFISSVRGEGTGYSLQNHVPPLSPDMIAPGCQAVHCLAEVRRQQKIRLLQITTPNI